MDTRPTSPRPLTITEIASAAFCEQKVIFDAERGRVESPSVRRKREEGVARHARFEAQGRRSQDRRCFIATAVYGPTAPETCFLRGWRDSRLLPTVAGRMCVRLYYAISPRLAAVLLRHPRLARPVRRMLDAVVRRLKGRE